VANTRYSLLPVQCRFQSFSSYQNSVYLDKKLLRNRQQTIHSTFSKHFKNNIPSYMKNLLFILSFLFVSEISYCDVIPENSHKFDKCVKIINVDDFPEYCLLAYMSYPTGGRNIYIINSKTCLEKGYHYSLNILAVKKEYLAKMDLNTTNWLKDKNALKSNIFIDSDGGYESNDNPISSIDAYYKIVGFTDTSVILYKCKELLRFIDGRPALIKTYKYDDGLSQIDNVEYDLLSFFKALLFTIIIETIVLFFIFKIRLKKLQIKNGVLFLTGILTSFSTLPYVWFVLPIFIKQFLLYIIISEFSVIFVESIIIWRLLTIDYKKAVVISFICNLTSFLFGLLINWI